MCPRPDGRRRVRALALSLAALALAPGHASARDLHVAPTGSDGAPCTLGLPCRQILAICSVP